MFNKKFILNLSGTVGTEEKYDKQAVVETILQACNKYGIDGFTILDSVGCYRGTLEKSYVLDILGTDDDYQRVVYIAYDVMESLEQEDIYLSVTDYESISIANLFDSIDN